MNRVFVFLIPLILTAGLPDARSGELTISGAVEKTVRVSVGELSRMGPVEVRLNEVRRDQSYRGSFVYRGIPLRTLLERAGIQKKNKIFPKPVDLAIRVQNRRGRRVALSFAEVYYRNPAEIVVAYSATPIRPHKGCTGCHKTPAYKKWLRPLDRQVGFPKLVASNDFYGDRSLESVTRIEVVELPGVQPRQDLEKLYSPNFLLKAKGKAKRLERLPEGPRHDELIKQVGEGKGFHGMRRFSGIPLRAVLKAEDVELSLDSVLLVCAPDGYRGLISAGELLLTRAGGRILLADRQMGEAIDENGKFFLVAPDDLSADRWVKAVSEIEIRRLP